METESSPFYSFLVTCATVKEKGGEWTPNYGNSWLEESQCAHECNSITYLCHGQAKCNTG